MSDNIQEAEVGSGTKISDTKQSEKRAQITLKAIQLRLKQEKERAALQAQKKSLSVKEEIGAIDELSTNKLADYKKKAGENASAADKAGDTKTGNKRFSGIMKATRKQFDNDAKKSVSEAKAKPSGSWVVYDGNKVKRFNTHSSAKMYAEKNGGKVASGEYYYDKIQKTEELSPKQKALDKNKNGKIDGSDLAKLRGEELSAKQKALDKNNNGKIDGSDLAMLRKKSVPESDAAYGAWLKAKEERRKMDNISSADKSKLSAIVAMLNKEKKKQPQGADFAAQRRKERMASNGRMDEAKSDYEVYHKDYSTAVQTAIKQAEKRGYEVDMDDWHDKVATGPKKPSSGKTNSFSINLMKDGKPSKKKLQMQVYNMDNHKYELNMYIEEVQQDVAEGYTDNDIETTRQFRNAIAGSKARSAIDKAKDGAGAKYYADGTKVTPQEIARRAAKRKPHLTKEGVVDEAGPGLWANIHAKRERIKAGSNERMRKPGEKGAPESGALDKARGKNEAVSPAQQAAIAIAMKKDGKKPKDMEEMTGDDKSSIALQAMVARKKLQQTAGKNKSQSFIDKMTSKANAGDRLPKKPADEYDRKVVKYLKKKHGMSEASVAETYEGVVDKIKAIKRGMQAKAKADDHFDKAGDPKNANASKDLKKAVRYQNLLNKEEVVLEARKKSFKDVKKKMKEEEMPNKSTVKKGDMLTGKREPIEINPELKEPAR